MAAGLIGALAPDLDSVARLWDPMAVIAVHRTVTHSLIGGGLIAFVAAGLAWGVGRENFLRLFGVAYLALLSHIGLDLLTSHGPAFLWPFTNRRFALSLSYMVDPVFITLVLSLLIISFRSRRKRTSLGGASLVGIVAYMFITWAHQSTALTQWREFITSQGIRPIRTAIIPLFPGPIRWLGLAETEGAFYQRRFFLYGLPSESPDFFSKTNDEDFESVQQLREVQLFLNFARFPWGHVRTEGSFRIVEYRDLAFADHPLGILGGPLSLRIWVDESNAVRKVELGHRF